MDWMAYIVALLFLLFGALCVLSIIVGLPGAWIMLAVALIIELAGPLYLPPERSQTFGWWVLIAAAGLGGLGEIIEFFAAAAGLKHGGGSRRGMIGALIGGIVGALLLTPLIPIPLLGTLIGAMLGTFAGAVIGEATGEQAKTVAGSMRPAIGATVGRAVGTAGKMGVGLAVWILLCVAAWVP